MIRLLQKSEIDSSKALARKLEIDEGLKLSRRVDSLRETAVAEEASLEAFRKKTVASISKEIDSLSKSKDVLRAEVAELENRRAQALVPLDDEWNTLKKSQQEHASSVILLEQQQAIYLAQSKDMHEKLADITHELARIQDRKKQSEEALQEILENKKDTEASLAYTRKLEHDAEEMRVNVLAELKERDAICASRERDVTLRDESLSLREEALRKAQILLDDQNAMLARDITRLMKQKNESNSKNRK